MDEKIVARAMVKMAAYSQGNLHDIAHYTKVHSFARTIGVLEGLSDEEQLTLELAAIVHDIACPLCHRKYGNTNGVYQEKEGGPLSEEFFRDMDIPESMKARIVYLVSHHHTYTNVDGRDYRILLEADFLVNADESHMSKEAVEEGKKKIFRTKTGTKLLEEIYQNQAA